MFNNYFVSTISRLALSLFTNLFKFDFELSYYQKNFYIRHNYYLLNEIIYKKVFN